MRQVGSPDEFAKLLEKHRGQSRKMGRKYDCIVPVSGGKDSLSALYRLVKEFDMSVLAYHYDSGFSDDQARLNLRNAIDRLGVDLVVNDDRTLQRKYLKYSLTKLVEQPEANLPYLSHILCTGCDHALLIPAFRLAQKHGIRLIVAGGSPIEFDFRCLYRSQGKLYRHISPIVLPFRKIEVGV